MKTIQTKGFEGYIAEKLASTNVPYRLHGPRGAQVNLVRNQHNRNLLFATRNGGGRGRGGVILTIKGHPWFTDKNGILEPASYRNGAIL